MRRADSGPRRRGAAGADPLGDPRPSILGAQLAILILTFHPSHHDVRSRGKKLHTLLWTSTLKVTACVPLSRTIGHEERARIANTRRRDKRDGERRETSEDSTFKV